MNELIAKRFEEHIATARATAQGPIPQQIDEVAQLFRKALSDGHKILFCGNGGSAADCQHIAAEFVGRFQKERDSLPALTLTVDTSILTSIANDYGYDTVFARQVSSMGNEGDVLVGISTSGNSPNVLKAMETARSRGIKTVGMTSIQGGKLKVQCDICLCVPTPVTARAQEIHILIGHILCEILDES